MNQLYGTKASGAGKRFSPRVLALVVGSALMFCGSVALAGDIDWKFTTGDNTSPTKVNAGVAPSVEQAEPTSTSFSVKDFSMPGKVDAGVSPLVEPDGPSSTINTSRSNIKHPSKVDAGVSPLVEPDGPPSTINTSRSNIKHPTKVDAGVSPSVEPDGPPSTSFVVEDYVGPGKVDAVQTSESVIDSFFDVFIDDDERIKETPGDTPEPGIFDRLGKNPEQKTENEKTVVDDSSPAGFGTGMNGSPGAGPALGGMGGMNPMMGPGGRANPMMGPGGAAGPGSPMMGGAMGGGRL
jgi:hypothetical protein